MHSIPLALAAKSSPPLSLSPWNPQTIVFPLRAHAHMSALSSVPFPSLSAVGTNALPNGSLTPPSTLRLHSRGHRHTLKRAHPRADLNTRDNVDMCQYCIPKCSPTLNTCTLQALMACQSSACTLMSGLGLTIHSQHCYTDTHAYTKTTRSNL